MRSLIQNMRRIQRNRILVIGAVLMTVTIKNLNLSSIVYAQQETIESEAQQTSEESSESISSEASAQVESENQTEEQTQITKNVQSNTKIQEIPQVSYKVQLEGKTKLERKEMKLPLEGWESVELQIEEVYVRKGNTLKAGDPIFKIGTESMQKLLEYYNNQVDIAQAKVEEKQLNYETEKKTAEYEREQAKQIGESAKSKRDTELQSLQTELTELAAQIESKTSELESYKKDLEDDTYYEEYGIAEMAQAVTDSKNLMENAQRTLSKVQSESNNVNSETVDLLKDLVEQAEDSYKLIQKQYSKLLSDYGKQVSEAQTKREELQDTVLSLQEKYNELEKKSESQDLEVNKAYDQAVLSLDQAETRYNLKVEALEEERNQAQKELEKWTKIREKIYEMEDGIVTAPKDMIISSFSYHNGDKIEKNRSLLTYDDADSVSVAVQVPQDEIIEWNIDDTVMVEIEGYEQLFSGTVTSMDLGGTAKNKDGDIEYTATISIEQGELHLPDGLKATVLSGEMIQDSVSQEENQTEVSFQDISSSSESNVVQPSEESSAQEGSIEESSPQESSESNIEGSTDQLSESSES